MFDSSTIIPDSRVLASDGTELGLVAVVADDGLRLQLPVGVAAGPQDVIPLSWVDTVEPGAVRLNRSEADARELMNHEVPADLPPG